LGLGGKEIEDMDLPKALQRFWVGTDVVGAGREKGEIHWM